MDLRVFYRMYSPNNVHHFFPHTATKIEIIYSTNYTLKKEGKMLQKVQKNIKLNCVGYEIDPRKAVPT
jgi:hypothetical protein